MSRLIEHFLAEHVGTEDNPLPFAGRSAEMKQLYEWVLDEGATHRAILTAPAAFGKSTLMAHFAHRLRGDDRFDVILHPVSIRLETRKEDDYIREVTAQVESIYRQAPGTFESFDRVLDALRLPPPGNRIIVLLIDGLDEALGWRPLFNLLPTRRAKHIKVLTSFRTTTPEQMLEDQVWRQTGFTKTFPLDLMSDDQIDALMMAARPHLDVETRARVSAFCKGQPLVARLLTDVPDLDKLDRLEAGLSGALRAWWTREEQAFPDVPARAIHDVLDLLACAHHSFSLDELDQLINAKDKALDTHELRRLLERSSRLIPRNTKGRYSFCHPFLAEHYRDGVLTESQRRRVRARLTEWIRKQVTLRKRGELATSDVSFYALRTAHSHLLEGGAGASELVGLTHPSWLEAWASSTDPAGALLMLSAIREAVTPSGVLANLADWTRCTLAEAKARSASARMSPWVTRERVLRGEQTAEQALAQIEMMSSPSSSSIHRELSEQNFALEVVAQALPNDLVPRAMDLAIVLEAAHFPQSLFALLPRFATLDARGAERAAHLLSSVTNRVNALLLIAEHVDDETEERLVTQAKLLARTCEAPWPRLRTLLAVDDLDAAWALACEHGENELRFIASALDDPRRQEAWRRIGELVVEDGGDITRHLESVPSELRAGQIAWLIEHGRETAVWSWAREHGRARWLCSTASADARERFLAAVINDLEAGEVAPDSTSLLQTVAEFLTTADRQRALDALLAHASADHAERARLALAANLPPQGRLRVFETTIAIQSSERAGGEVEAAMARLDAEDRAAALDITEAHVGSARAAYAAYRLAPDDEHRWRRLLAAIPDEYDRAVVWIGLLRSATDETSASSFLRELGREIEGAMTSFERTSLILVCGDTFGHAVAEYLFHQCLDGGARLEERFEVGLLASCIERFSDSGIRREVLAAAFARNPTSETLYEQLPEEDRAEALERAVEALTPPEDPTLALLAAGHLGSNVELADMETIPPVRIVWALRNAEWLDVEVRRERLCELLPEQPPMTQLGLLPLLKNEDARNAVVSELFEKVCDEFRLERASTRRTVPAIFPLPDAASGLVPHLSVDQITALLSEVPGEWYGLRALLVSRLPVAERIRERNSLMASANAERDPAIALASLCVAFEGAERDGFVSRVLATDTPSKPGLLNLTVRWARPVHSLAISARLVDLLSDESTPSWHGNAVAYIDAIPDDTRPLVVRSLWGASEVAASENARRRLRTILLPYVEGEQLLEALRCAEHYFDLRVANTMSRDLARYDDHMLRVAFGVLERWRSRQTPPLRLLPQLGRIAIEQVRRGGASPRGKALITSALDGARDQAERFLEAIRHLAPLIREVVGEAQARAVGDAILEVTRPPHPTDANTSRRRFVFICYRRSDTREFADRLAKDLRDQLDPQAVFIDEDDVEAGSEWPRRLEEAIERASGTIVIVGPRWLERDTEGKRRIDDECDWVRREIATTLRMKKACVPIRFDDTPEDLGLLPDDIAPLLERKWITYHRRSYDLALNEVVRWAQSALES